MAAIVNNVVGSILSEYFSLFFRNFKKEDFDFGKSTTLSNLEINTDVVEEILNLPTLSVTRMYINTLTITVKHIKVHKVPIEFNIDEITCILSEPIDLKPVPTVLADFLKKFSNNKQSSYGMAEKVIDGFLFKISKLNIQVQTKGKYKVEQVGAWTPPPLFIELKNIEFATTDERWQPADDLKLARKFNEGKQVIYVFKEMNIEHLNVYTKDTNDIPIYLVRNTPIKARLIIQKNLDNTLKSMSMEIIISKINITFKAEQLGLLVKLLGGVSACFGRRDIAAINQIEKEHAARLLTIHINTFTMTLLHEKTAKGIYVSGNFARVTESWAENAPGYKKEIEATLGSLVVAEYSSRNGPSSHKLFASEVPEILAKNPTQELPDMIPIKSLHPTTPFTTYDKPLFFAKIQLGKPPDSLAFEMKFNANPFQLTFRPENVSSILDLVASCTPYIKEIQKNYELKPEGDLSNVLIQEGNSFLQDQFRLLAKIQHISISFPSSEDDEFVQVTINIKNTQVVSLPENSKHESQMYQPGSIGSLVEYPGNANDLVFTKNSLKSISHVDRIDFYSSVEWTVQFANDPPQIAFEMPEIHVELNLSLGEFNIAPSSPNSASTDKKLEPLLIECYLWISKIYGKLTQRQYRAVLSRIDQLLLLVPAIQKISSASTNYEKPRIQLIFILSIADGEWVLFNDESVGVDIGELAKLHFKSFQICAENGPTSQVTKFLLKSCHLTALPIAENYSSNLSFHPNSFLVTGSDAPLIALRVSLHQHPSGELLIKPSEETPSTELTVRQKLREYITNRAFYDGPDRSLIDLRLSSLHLGFNPNPACKILQFFLKSELNIQRMIATVRTAKDSLEKSLENVEISAIANDFAEGFAESVSKSLDIDVRILISDTKVYFVQDSPYTINNNIINGNIELSAKAIEFKKQATSKFNQETLSRIDSIGLVCNKEENGIILPIEIFKSPISGEFRVNTNWDQSISQWIIKVSGALDKFLLNVDPSHATVFMNVIHGIKMQNIQEVVDSIGSYINQAKKEIPLLMNKDKIEKSDSDTSFSRELSTPSLVLQPISNPLKDTLEVAISFIDNAEKNLEEAKNEYSTTSQLLKTLEEKTGKVDIVAQAAIKSPVKVIEGKKLLSRFAVITKNGGLYIFQNNTGGNPLASLQINAATKINMIQNRQFCFQIVGSQSTITMETANEMDMSQWINEILRRQCAGVLPTSDSFAKATTALASVKCQLDTISTHIESLGEHAQLLAKIKQLEDAVKERDAKIATLTKN